MPSRQPVRSALPIVFGVSVIVAVGFADTAAALPTTPTTVVQHTTQATPTTAPKPEHIALLPPTTAVLTLPISAASAGSPVVVAPGSTPLTEAGPHAATLPPTL
jgi:hypothetical protein